MEEKNYICFFDLLGTKALVSNSPSLYIETIKKYSERLQNAYDFCKDSLSIHAFSDCAYIETKDLLALCSFMNKLRSDLMSEDIYFNAAICEGSLGIQTEPDTRKLGYFFYGQKAVEVFAQQTSFTGIGINLSPSVAKQLKSIIKKSKKAIQFNVVTSSYISLCPQQNGFEFKSFNDISYSNEMIDIFDSVVSSFVDKYVLNKRASRYYFSIICTLLKSILLNGKIKDSQIVSCIHALEIVDNESLRNAMLLKIFEISCSNIKKIEELEVVEIKDYIQDSFDLFWKEGCFDKISDLNKISEQIISRHYRKPLSLLIAERKTAQT